MGRQIHFYMLPADGSKFLRIVQEHDSTTMILRDSDSSQVEPISGGRALTKHFASGPAFEPRPKMDTKPGYYRVGTLHTPILEFTASFSATWGGQARSRSRQAIRELRAEPGQASGLREVVRGLGALDTTALGKEPSQHGRIRRTSRLQVLRDRRVSASEVSSA
jgi:hypothetical protein